jgi:gliding motility-associated-like protein
MKGDILCNSIAADGSDFEVIGPSQVIISGASQANCNNGLIKNIRIQLKRPITLGGQYTVRIKQGSDGNTLLNVCNEATQDGSIVNFIAYDTVAGRINVTRGLSCTADTITLSHDGANGVNRWRWLEEGVGLVGTTPSITRVYTTGDEARLSLEVSNGICTDSGVIVLGIGAGRIEAEFSYPAFACPGDTVIFSNQSKGPVTQWLWNLGNGNTSPLENPPMQFYTSIAPLSQVPVTLIATGFNGCRDTVVHTIQVPNNCYVAVPNAFTPNGDGLNDFLYPLNAWKATDLLFRVYNRYGQLIWETTDWTRKWDGRTGGQPMPSGTLIWILQYTEADTGKNVVQKGTTTLIR